MLFARVLKRAALLVIAIITVASLHPMLQQWQTTKLIYTTTIAPNNASLQQSSSSLTTDLPIVEALHHQFSHNHATKAAETITLSEDLLPSRVPLHKYTQQHIAQYIQQQPGVRFHILVYDGSQFHLYRIGASPSIPLTCYCRQHWIELLIDGLVTARPHRFVNNQHNSSTTLSSSSTKTWQLLMDVTRDSISYPCWGKEENCTADPDSPPVVTLASVPRMAKVHAPFIYQFPLTYYNDCLFHLYRQRSTNNSDANHETTGTNTICELHHNVHQFMNATDEVWDSLIPQVYWRGTCLAFVSVHYKQCTDVLPPARGNLTKAQIADLIMPDPNVNPRCRGVAMTLQAESEWEQLKRNHNSSFTTRNHTLPWINIKYGGQPRLHNRFRQLGYDLFVGEYMSSKDMAQYKYQIDLGGSGGTTWLGTITKLAMPGLLFHHKTPMKDWFYDEIQPWVHYVPINTNLSNLYDMFVWAETHPDEAKRIAERGQQYARHQVSRDHFAATFYKLYVQQLGAIADNYQPSRKPEDGEETLESILHGYEEAGLFAKQMATCTKDDCQFFIRRWTMGW